MITDYTYLEKQKRRKLPVILQIIFLLVGAGLIIAFAILFDEEPQKADALLFSPLSTQQAPISNNKKDYSYKLLYGDRKQIVYKESDGNENYLKVVNLSTNITDAIASGKRIGFIGQSDQTNLLFLEDTEGEGKFTVIKYDIIEKTTTPLLAFQAIPTLALGELNNLVDISPDKTKLVFVHESGIVVYTIKSEKEKTILENKDCENGQNCLDYKKPSWINNNQLLVFQETKENKTPMVVDLEGNILSVLPANFTDISVFAKDTQNQTPSLLGVTDTGIHLIDIKKTALLIESPKETIFSQPVWLGDKTIISLETIANVPAIIKIDKSSKKTIALLEFPTSEKIQDLITDPYHENIFFTQTQQGENNLNITFYKMGVKDEIPVSFYSISKNL